MIHFNTSIAFVNLNFPVLRFHINHKMARLSCYHDRRQFRLNQRLNVIHQLLAYIGAVICNPLKGHFFLDICDFMDIIEVCGTDIGVLGNSIKP